MTGLASCSGRGHPPAWLSSLRCGRAFALASESMKVFIGSLVLHTGNLPGRSRITEENGLKAVRRPDPDRGFLPGKDPLREPPPHFAPWEDVAHDIGKLIVAGRLRSDPRLTGRLSVGGALEKGVASQAALARTRPI